MPCEASGGDRHVLYTRRTQFQDTKFPLPKVRLERELDWVTDEEFGRQMLAGDSHVLSQPCTASSPRCPISFVLA